MLRANKEELGDKEPLSCYMAILCVDSMGKIPPAYNAICTPSTTLK